MLSFSLNLSFQSCRILLGVKSYNDALVREGLTYEQDQKRNLTLWAQYINNKFSHFVTHARVLSDNGLISDCGWELTRKGELVCEVLELEFQEFREAGKLPAKRTRKIKS